MAHELVVALHVTDDAGYLAYRDAMAPLLARHGGGFRYDFVVARTLRSASDHPINRVFAIYFGSRAEKEAFYAHPDYLAIKARHFEPSVAGRTVLGAYER
jgi:uncharacterized protein (DUF1330 family)